MLKSIEDKGWPFLLDLGSHIVQNYVRKIPPNIWGHEIYMEQQSPCEEVWEPPVSSAGARSTAQWPWYLPGFVELSAVTVDYLCEERLCLGPAHRLFAEICWRSTTLWILKVSHCQSVLLTCEADKEPWMVKREEIIAKDPGFVVDSLCVDTDPVEGTSVHISIRSAGKTPTDRPLHHPTTHWTLRPTSVTLPCLPTPMESINLPPPNHSPQH